MGCVPVLSAAYGSLRSCECLLESKFVKRDGSSMNEHSGWEALPPLSPLTIRAETVERFSCHNIQTHTHTLTRRVYTHVHVHSLTKPRVIRLWSCILFHFFLRPLIIFSWTASTFFPHSFILTFLTPSLSPATQWQTTTMEAWSKTKLNKT